MVPVSNKPFRLLVPLLPFSCPLPTPTPSLPYLVRFIHFSHCYPLLCPLVSSLTLCFFYHTTHERTCKALSAQGAPAAEVDSLAGGPTILCLHSPEKQSNIPKKIV